jgi:hypothetical protein
MDAGRIEPSPKDVRVARGVTDKANAARGDRYPQAEDYMKSPFADIPLPSALNRVLVILGWISPQVQRRGGHPMILDKRV